MKSWLWGQGNLPLTCIYHSNSQNRLSPPRWDDEWRSSRVVWCQEHYWIWPGNLCLPLAVSHQLCDARKPVSSLSCWFLTYKMRMSMRACMLSHFCHVWLCNPVDGSPPGSSVPGILQARRTLEWVAMLSSIGSSWPRYRTCVSYVSLHWQMDSLSHTPPGTRG